MNIVARHLFGAAFFSAGLRCGESFRDMPTHRAFRRLFYAIFA